MSLSENGRVEILLEDIRSNVQLLAEGHGALVEEVRTLNGKVDGIAADVGVLKIDVGSLNQRMHRVEGHLGLNGAPPKAKSTRPGKARKKAR